MADAEGLAGSIHSTAELSERVSKVCCCQFLASVCSKYDTATPTMQSPTDVWMIPIPQNLMRTHTRQHSFARHEELQATLEINFL